MLRYQYLLKRCFLRRGSRKSEQQISKATATAERQKEASPRKGEDPREKGERKGERKGEGKGE